MRERRADDELSARLSQQATAAELGRRALAGAGGDELMEAAADAVAAGLGAPYVSIVELGVDGEVERARIGKPPAAGRLRRREATAVPIAAGGHQLGELRTAGRRADDFSGDDVNFLRGVANTLAAVFERERSARAIRAEHRRLEEALAQVSESEARFRELADSAPVLIWTADAAGMIDFINRGWLDFTGHALDEVPGDARARGVHSEDAEGVRATWRRAFARRVPWEREYRLRRHDGEYRWIVDRGVPRFAGDELVGYVGTATDIHERKEMEQKLSLAYARDHEVAETLQRSLLPERLPHIDGVALEARYLPAARGTAIGGDFYDALELDDGRVAVVVGDVVGHGLRAATVMGQLRNAFRAYALVETSPAQTLARLNRLLAKEDRDVMATALYLILDRDTGEIDFASAGHPPALVVMPEGAHYLEGGRSVPLGTADPAVYTDASARIEPGATLLLYTDGLVERRDTPLDDRLAQLATVAEVAGGELADVCDQVLSGVLGGLRPTDDVALLAVRPDPVGAGALSMRLPADPTALAQIRRRIGRFLQAAGATAEERFEITLTVSEAAMNAIEHAYGPVDAEFELWATLEAGAVVVTVTDSGRWRERRDADRGRGLSIIRGLMDEVEVTPGPRGTTVRMRRRLGPRAAPAAAVTAGRA